MTLGERIKTLRQEQGLSQEVLAERLGVSRQAVSKWEKDLSRPDTENLLALASVFGVSIDELAGNKAESAEEHTRRRPTLGRVVFTAVLTLAVVLGVIAALHFFRQDAAPAEGAFPAVGEEDGEDATRTVYAAFYVLSNDKNMMSEDIYINRRKIFDNLQHLDWWAFGLLGEAGHEDETRLELTRWLSEQPRLSLEEIDGLMLGGCRSNLDGYLTDSYCAVLANAFIAYPEHFVKRMSGENLSDPERRQIVSLTAYGCAAPEETFERALEAAEEITGDPLRYTERELVWGKELAAAIRGQ